MFNEVHLRRIMKRYADYYNKARTYLSLGRESPSNRPIEYRGVITPAYIRQLTSWILQNRVIGKGRLNTDMIVWSWPIAVPVCVPNRMIVPLSCLRWAACLEQWLSPRLLSTIFSASMPETRRPYRKFRLRTISSSFMAQQFSVSHYPQDIERA